MPKAQDAAVTMVIRDHHGGKPKEMRSRRKCWTDAVEARFLDVLAMTCNVTMALEAADFTAGPVYRRRRADPGFAARWRVALDVGYDRLEARLIECAERALSGLPPMPDSAFPDMSVAQAMQIMDSYRRTVKEGRTRTSWRRQDKPVDEVRASIARKLDAIERTRG